MILGSKVRQLNHPSENKMSDIFFHSLPELDIDLREYFSVLGRALFTAQHFETNCRALAACATMETDISGKGFNELDTPEFNKKIAMMWKDTLGASVKYLKSRIEFPNEIAQALADATKARNEVAHWTTVGLNEFFDSELIARITEIRNLVLKIAIADKYIAILLHAVNKSPPPMSRFFEEYEKKVADWVCEPADNE
jgi:hypothetical protein